MASAVARCHLFAVGLAFNAIHAHIDDRATVVVLGSVLIVLGQCHMALQVRRTLLLLLTPTHFQQNAV
uniref:Putative secreted protein n=1 Tax=Anopheles marajoara TaxID=58244 RepID=A0A2M4CFH4_9DIPT